MIKVFKTSLICPNCGDFSLDGFIQRTVLDNEDIVGEEVYNCYCCDYFVTLKYELDGKERRLWLCV